MDPSLHVEPPVEQQHSLTFFQRFQQKLAESRYFMLSCVIHGVIVILAGSFVIYKTLVEPQEFVAAGGDGLISPTDPLAVPPETPPEPVSTKEVTPQTPNINSPTIDVLTSTSPSNNFKVAPTRVQPKINPMRSDLGGDTNGSIAISSGLAKGLPITLGGRTGSGRLEAMKKNNMRTKSEVAVINGLNWLQQNQNSDGSWGDANQAAMTGFGLLCFLGHGETPDSPQYGLTVNRAVQWMIDNGTKNEGRLNMQKAFSQPGVYEHAICAYALGEYYTMTKDKRVIELFKQAVGHIVQGQGPGGGWMYTYDKTADDLSVSGWQIQALKAAHLSELNIAGADQALDKAMSYIDRVKGPKGGYGYRAAEDRYSLTGVGILCQLFWKGDRGALTKGMQWMLDETEKKFPVKYKGEHADLYAWYYHTQACLMVGGSAWTKWNKWFQDEICDVQSPDGSWPVAGGKAAGNLQTADNKTGAVYRTTLCILMLEVFYRYMPTNQG